MATVPTEFWKLLDEEIDGLRKHVECGGPLLEKVRQTGPDSMQVLALSAFLFCFYAGIERTLGIIAQGMDEKPSGMPDDEDWRRRLLDAMTAPTEKRPSLLTTKLRDELLLYLAFHHAFDNTYWEKMSWEQMRPLVFDMPRVLAAFLVSVEDLRGTLNDSDAGGKD